MKRFAYLPIFLSFLLGGCTLMMDEIPEENENDNVNLEEVGFSEPYTQESEFGSVTFQYGDSTRVLRQEALNYLVKVENDSVLYFTDNIPQNLLIPVGRYVSMGCNEKLRRGLCSQVISLTKANGMCRMVTSRRPYSVVFKQMDVDISAEYDQQMGFDPFHYLEEQGMINENGDTDSIFTDWALFGDATVKRKKAEIQQRIKARKKMEALTRANDKDKDKDEPEDLDTGDKTIKDKCVSLFSITLSDIETLEKLGIKKLVDAELTKNVDFEFSCGFHEKTTLRHIQKVSNGQDYVRDSYKETPYIAYSAKYTYKKQLEFTPQDLYKKIFAKIKKPEPKGLDLPSPAIHIPIPLITAIEFFIKIEPSVTMSLALTGEVNFTQELGTSEKIVEYENGKQKGDATYNVNTESNNKFKFTKFDVCGSFEFDASIGALAGFSTTGGTFGLGIGAKVGLNITFKKTVPFSSDDGGSLDVYLKPYIKAFATSPAGKDWASIEWSIPGLKPKYSLLPEQKFPFFPELGSPTGSVSVDSNGGKPAADVTVSFKVTDLNLMQYSGTEHYEIGANFYDVTTYAKGVFIGPGINKKLTTMQGQKYEFSIRDDDYFPGKQYKVVPYVKDILEEGSKGYYHYEQNAIKPSYTKGSTMTNVDLFINNYSDGWNKDPSKDTNTEEWVIVQQVQITNLEKMVDWSEWGVEVSMRRYDADNNFINEPLHNKKFNVSEVVYENNVFLVFRLRVKPREKYNFEVEFTPYYKVSGENDPHYVKNSDLYKMELKLVRDWEGENEQYWRLDKTVNAKLGSQIVDMGLVL